MALSLLTTAALAAGRFTDVKSGDYFAASVEWAVAEGITNGAGDGTTFFPNTSLSTVSDGELRLSAFCFLAGLCFAMKRRKTGRAFFVRSTTVQFHAQRKFIRKKTKIFLPINDKCIL